MIILIAPAAYHRIVEEGEATEGFYRWSSKLVVASLVPLALGMCRDLFVVMESVIHSLPIALVISSLMLAWFYGLWFGFFHRRKKKVAASAETKILKFSRSS